MNKCVRNLSKFAAIAMMLFATLNLAAQEITGSIRGTVSDPTQANVQNASVTAIQVETGLARSVVTDRLGDFLLVELPIGHYKLEVRAQGFQKYLREGITLDVNESATVPVHLKVGSDSQQVQVNANADLRLTGATSRNSESYSPVLSHSRPDFCRRAADCATVKATRSMASAPSRTTL